MKLNQKTLVPAIVAGIIAAGIHYAVHIQGGTVQQVSVVVFVLGVFVYLFAKTGGK